MGLFDNFRKKANTAIVGISEAGIGLISRGNLIWGSKVDSEPQNVPLQQRYNNAYLNFPIVAAAIDVTAEQVVQDFHFLGPDEEFLTKWSDQVNLGDKFYTIAKHILKNGNIWAEFPSKMEMKFTDPLTMTTHRNQTGEVIGYSQNIDGTEKVLWGTTGDQIKDAMYANKGKFANMVQFTYNKLAGEKYGTPITHSVLPLLNLKDQVEADLRVIIRRYAAPIIEVSVGDENHMPKESDITDIKSALRDIYADTEYVHNYLTKFNVLGFQGKAMNVAPYLEHIDKNIASGLQTPSELIGLSSSNKSEAEVKLRSYGRHIKSIQRQIRDEFEDHVIQGILGLSSENKLIWGEAEEREAEIFIDQVRGLVTDGIISPQKANDLLPPKFAEKLPEEYSKPLKAAASTFQDQTPYQKGADAIKNNPNDPTLHQKEPGQRRVKTDTQIPLGGAK